MSTERQDRTLRRKPLPAALLALALAALVPYSAHSKVAASFQGRLTNEVQNGVCIARTRDALGRDTGYTLCALPEGGRVALVATAPDSSVTNSNGEKGTGPQFLQRSKSYHSELANKSYEEILDLAKGKGPLAKAAKQMKKLIEQAERLLQKTNKD